VLKATMWAVVTFRGQLLYWLYNINCTIVTIRNRGYNTLSYFKYYRNSIFHVRQCLTYKYIKNVHNIGSVIHLSKFVQVQNYTLMCAFSEFNKKNTIRRIKLFKIPLSMHATCAQ